MLGRFCLSFTLSFLGLLLFVIGCGEKTEPTANQPVASSPALPPPPPLPPGVTRPVAPSPAPTVVLSDFALAQKSVESQARLARISDALFRYMENHNYVVPPAYVADSDGKPLYSWRVLLLPELGRQDLYDRFDKKQAWDSPANLAISNEAVDLYKSPADPNVAPNGVNYVAIVGPGFLFQGPTPTRGSDILDGFSNTVSAFELRGIAGSWAAPVDPRVENVRWQIGTGPGELNSPYADKLQGALIDGKSRRFARDYISKIFPAGLGIGDGIIVENF